MKSMKTKQSLTDAEIREGIDRLMSSALIKASDSKFEHAANLAGQFRCADVDRSSSALEERCDIGDRLTSVIFDLAVALVTSRLTENEAFRLGTSKEAMQLFESDCAEWNDPRTRAYNESVSGVSARRTVSASALVRRIDRMLRHLGQKQVSKNISPEALELWGRDLGVLRCDEKVAGTEEAGA
jgi:hypothetical protein